MFNVGDKADYFFSNGGFHVSGTITDITDKFIKLEYDDTASCQKYAWFNADGTGTRADRNYINFPDGTEPNYHGSDKGSKLVVTKSAQKTDQELADRFNQINEVRQSLNNEQDQIRLELSARGYKLAGGKHGWYKETLTKTFL